MRTFIFCFLFLAIPVMAATPYEEAVALGLPKFERKDFSDSECKKGNVGGFEVCQHSFKDGRMINIGYLPGSKPETYLMVLKKPMWPELEARYGAASSTEAKKAKAEGRASDWVKNDVAISAWEKGGEFSVLFMRKAVSGGAMEAPHSMPRPGAGGMPAAGKSIP